MKLGQRRQRLYSDMFTQMEHTIPEQELPFRFESTNELMKARTALYDYKAENKLEHISIKMKSDSLTLTIQDTRSSKKDREFLQSHVFEQTLKQVGLEDRRKEVLLLLGRAENKVIRLDELIDPEEFAGLFEEAKEPTNPFDVATGRNQSAS